MAFDAGDLGASALPELPTAKIVERFTEALKACRKEDMMRGVTTIGPQRDELRFLVNGHDLGLYGSRGQNRTAIWPSLASWLAGDHGQWPILLDGRRTDEKRRAYLLGRSAGPSRSCEQPPSWLAAWGFLKTTARWRRMGQISGGYIRRCCECLIILDHSPRDLPQKFDYLLSSNQNS
jgi:hypothetical protein